MAARTWGCDTRRTPLLQCTIAFKFRGVMTILLGNGWTGVPTARLSGLRVLQPQLCTCGWGVCRILRHSKVTCLVAGWYMWVPDCGPVYIPSTLPCLLGLRRAACIYIPYHHLPHAPLELTVVSYEPGSPFHTSGLFLITPVTKLFVLLATQNCPFCHFSATMSSDTVTVAVSIAHRLRGIRG